MIDRSNVGPLFPARLSGTCGWCSNRIKADDLVGFVDGTLFCQVCRSVSVEINRRDELVLR